jgi:hypothetical protein
MSIESECEILLTKLKEWAEADRKAAATSETELKNYWLGRADGWEEAGIHLGKIVDDNATVPLCAYCRRLEGHPACSHVGIGR